MPDKLQGRIKQEYKRGLMILMGGVEFHKDTWTDIPKGKEELAQKTLGDILDFQLTSAPDEAAVEVALVDETPQGPHTLSDLEETLQPAQSEEPEYEETSTFTRSRSKRGSRRKKEETE